MADGRRGGGYNRTISTEQIKEAAVSLPVADRLKLAELLQESAHEELAGSFDDTEVEEAERRAREMESGGVQPVPHLDVVHVLRQIGEPNL